MRRTGYGESAIPEPFTVCGVRLRPFSLGHAMILDRFAKDADGLGRMLLGLAVCSRDYAGALRLFSSRWRLLLALRIIGLRIKLGRVNLVRALSYWNAYVTAGTAHIEAWESEKGGKPVEAPPHAILKIYMMEKLGMTEADALNKPLGLAASDLLISRSMSGDLDLVGDFDFKPLTEAEKEALTRGA